MALLKNLELIDNFGESVSFQNAYIRVEELSGSKSKITAKIVSYKAKDGACLTSQFVDFAPALDGLNFIAQAYEFLKTLPEFTDAIDC